jgi:hypothetical protein
MSDPKHRDDLETASWPQDDFSRDLGHGSEAVDSGSADDATRTLANSELPALNDVLERSERDRLSVLRPGTRLEQGSTYVDLARLDDGPFTAMGGREASEDEVLLSKRTTDHEAWSKLVRERDDAGDAG